MAEKKIKLLVFCYGGDYGGVDAFLENLLPCLAMNCEIAVYSFKPCGFAENIPKDTEIEYNIIKINAFTLLADYIKLIRYVKKKKIQILLSNEFSTNIFCAPLQLFMPEMRHLSVIHCDYRAINTDRVLLFLINILKRAAAHFIDRFICVSKYVASAVIEDVGPDKISVIPNGIRELRKKDKVDNGRFNIAYVGRISPEKGIGKFMEISARMSDDKTVFSVFSGTTSSQSIKRYVTDKGPAVFRGFVDKPLQKEDIDLLLVPSITEGCPIVILEAFMLKIPVIASGAGGIPELIENGKTGFLCLSGETDEYKRKIELLIKHPEIIKSICEEAYKKYLQCYTRNIMAGEYLALMRRYIVPESLEQ